MAPLTSIHIHEDDWGMRNLYPLQAAGDAAHDLAASADAEERNRAPGGMGWTDVHVIETPSLTYADVGLTFAAADAALSQILPRVRRFAASIGAAIGREERDPYGSYENDAYCYAYSRGGYIKLDGKGELVERIWFDANTNAEGLRLIRRGLEAIDALAPSVVADYWVSCTGAVRDAAFMDTYIRHLSGDA